MKLKLNKILTAFLIIIMVFGTLIGCTENGGNPETSERAVATEESGDKPKKDYSNIVENPNIAIPGYESLTFTAGKKKQSVNFYNPKENTCYFRISLVLKGDGEGADGTVGDDKAKVADGTNGAASKEEVLWTSELIEPGEEIKSIKLEKELESGDYPAILKYECFSLKDETPLNGSNVELILTVR